MAPSGARTSFWIYPVLLVLEVGALLCLVSALMAIVSPEIYYRYQPRAAYHPAFVAAWPLFLAARYRDSQREDAAETQEFDGPAVSGRIVIWVLAFLTMAVGAFLIAVGSIGIAGSLPAGVLLIPPGLLAMALGLGVLLGQRKYATAEDIEQLKRKSIFSRSPSFLVEREDEDAD